MHVMLEASIYLAAALVAVPLFRRLGFGAVLGYLAAGMLIGPWGLGLIGDVESVLQFSEIGVVFLLFVIGLELKPSRLWLMRRSIFVTGTLQVLFATVPLAALLHWVGLEWRPALLAGFALALSSTAFVLQSLGERNQLSARHGRAAFGILLFQDLAVIPFIALLPMLAVSGSDTGGTDIWSKVGLAVAAMFGLFIAGHYLLRPVFRMVARWGSEETFSVAALLVVIGAASLMEWAELSMGLGAFLAGVLLADSEYRHELEANINPFKGLLLGLFFISVGMSADFGIMGRDPVPILVGTAALLSIKFFTLWAVAGTLGYGHPSSLRLALVLAQGGEFAFVLLHAATGLHIFPHEITDQLIAIVILSMVVTPLMFLLSDWFGKRDKSAAPARPFDEIEDESPPVLIAGFGRVGQVVARVLQMRGIHFTALEQDVEHVDLVRRWGNKIYYGEPTNLQTLRAAGAENAKLLVIAMDDAEKAIHAVELAKRHFPHLKIYARARDRHHALHLMDLGVDYLIRETWLSSLEMAREVLQVLGDSKEAADYSVDIFSEADHDLLQRQLKHRHDLDHMIQSSHEVRRELAEVMEGDPKMSTLKPKRPSGDDGSSRA